MSEFTVSAPKSNRWAEAWPDALAFAGGLAVAWFAGWQTTDLVWSLWLSSLVVGYATIVWMIFGPAVWMGRRLMQDQTVKLGTKEVPRAALGTSAYLVGALFMLGFFTVHFGMFHFVHSVFLAGFFPLDPQAPRGAPGLSFYGDVFRAYWLFLPIAFVAERKGFRLGPEAPASADTAVTSEAIQSRKKKPNPARGMMAPYVNVIRMHLLIFFFAFASIAKLEHFLVYAVVYAVYFFPWRLLRKDAVN